MLVYWGFAETEVKLQLYSWATSSERTNSATSAKCSLARPGSGMPGPGAMSESWTLVSTGLPAGVFVGVAAVAAPVLDVDCVVHAASFL